MRKNIVNLSGVQIISLLGEEDSHIAIELMENPSDKKILKNFPKAFEHITISDNFRETFENRWNTFQGYKELSEEIKAPMLCDIDFQRLSEFDSKTIALFSNNPELLALNLSNSVIENSKALVEASMQKIDENYNLLDSSLKNEVIKFCEKKGIDEYNFNNIEEYDLDFVLAL